MSVSLMGQVYQIDPQDITATEAAVLLALADSANDDDATTWIPVKRRAKTPVIRADGKRKLDLAWKTKLGVRAIQFALRKLEADGHLSRQEIVGKGVIYTIHPKLKPLVDQRAGDGQREEERAAQGAGGESDSRVNLETPRGESDSPKTSITVMDIGGAPPGADAVEDTKATLAVKPDFMDRWAAFVAMRKDKHRKVNPTSAAALFRSLVRLARDGFDPGDVVDQSTVNCWTGFWPLKDDEEHGERIDRRGGDSRNGHEDGGFRNPMVRAAARAAGVGRHPGPGSR